MQIQVLVDLEEEQILLVRLDLQTLEVQVIHPLQVHHKVTLVETMLNLDQIMVVLVALEVVALEDLVVQHLMHQVVDQDQVVMVVMECQIQF